jgi:hypothetical protein
VSEIDLPVNDKEMEILNADKTDFNEATILIFKEIF